MARHFARTGRQQELPIVGEKVVEICFGSRGPLVLVFGDDYATRIRIEDAVTLSRGANELVLRGSRPGETFNIGELGPVLETYGQEVKEAVALKDGTLRVRFENELVLSVVPSSGYEAWHFESPKLRLDGAYGRVL